MPTKLTEDDILEILQSETQREIKGDCVYMGLMVLKRFMEDEAAVTGAINNVLYSVPLSRLVELDIPRAQFENLRDMGWDIVKNTDGKTLTLAYYVN